MLNFFHFRLFEILGYLFNLLTPFTTSRWPVKVPFLLLAWPLPSQAQNTPWSHLNMNHANSFFQNLFLLILKPREWKKKRFTELKYMRLVKWSLLRERTSYRQKPLSLFQNFYADSESGFRFIIRCLYPEEFSPLHGPILTLKRL